MNKEQVKDIAKDCGLVVGQHWNRSNMTTAFMLDFANAAIESYKAELLNEVGEPVVWASQESESGDIAIDSEDNPATEYWSASFPLYTSDQVAAAIAKATKPLIEELDAAVKALSRYREVCGGEK